MNFILLWSLSTAEKLQIKNGTVHNPLLLLEVEWAVPPPPPMVSTAKQLHKILSCFWRGNGQNLLLLPWSLSTAEQLRKINNGTVHDPLLFLEGE